MRLFRRHLDLDLAAPREAVPDDLSAISRLFLQSSHRFVGLPGTNMASLLVGAPVMLLTTETEVWGALIAGWCSESTTWIRGFALADGLLIGAACDMLLPPFHALLRTLDLQTVYYAGDETADAWIQPMLQQHGYVRETDVVVYEKTKLDIPARGNQFVRIRRAQSADLPALLDVDRRCFEPQWHKEERILGPSIFEGLYFVVAERAGAVIGYAFATSHFDGRLIHLVRIAVLPEFQGQAIGVRLLSDLVEFARMRGADVLTLNTQAHNHSAQRLYEWFGFRRTGEQQTILKYQLLPHPRIKA